MLPRTLLKSIVSSKLPRFGRSRVVAMTRRQLAANSTTTTTTSSDQTTATTPTNASTTTTSSASHNLESNESSHPKMMKRTLDQNPQQFFKELDNRQQKYLQEQQRQKPGFQKGEKMPPDLLAFISSNPIIEVQLQQPTKQRIPRYLRDDDNDEEEDEEDGDDKKRESKNDNAKVQTDDGPHSRMMPLMDQVPGFETLRTTNFSSRRDRSSTRDYKDGDIVDIYDLISRKNTTGHLLREENNHSDRQTTPELDAKVPSPEELATTAAAEEPTDQLWASLAEQVYQEYAEKQELPKKEEHRILHKQLLTHTLQFLSIPILVRDEVAMDGFHGIHPDDYMDQHGHPLAWTRRNLQPVPQTVAKLVLEDLSDARKKITTTPEPPTPPHS